MSDGTDPLEAVRKLFARFGGAFPTTADGLENVVERLESACMLPPTLAAHSARWPVRVIGAFVAPFDEHPIDLVRWCGMGHIPATQAVAMVEGMGYWEGEATPKQIRAYLRSVTLGTHPTAAAAEHGISTSDALDLEFLVETRQLWHNCVIDRVHMVYANGGGWWKTARELGTFRPGVLRSWIRAYRWYEQTGDYPQVDPVVIIPDAFT